MDLAGPKLVFRQTIQKTFLKIYNVLGFFLVFTEIIFGGIFYWLKICRPFLYELIFNDLYLKKKYVSGSHDKNKNTYISNIYFYSSPPPHPTPPQSTPPPNVVLRARIQKFFPEDGGSRDNFVSREEGGGGSEAYFSNFLQSELK